MSPSSPLTSTAARPPSWTSAPAACRTAARQGKAVGRGKVRSDLSKLQRVPKVCKVCKVCILQARNAPAPHLYVKFTGRVFKLPMPLLPPPEAEAAAGREVKLTRQARGCDATR